MSMKTETTPKAGHTPVELDGALPESVKLMLAKFHRSSPPNESKTLEVACVIHATDLQNIIWCLNDLIQRLEQGGVGCVGHGAGRYGSMAWAAVNHATKALAGQKGAL